MSVKQGRARLRDARERLQREFLIEAAERCFAEKGVEGTKMEEVAREAGLSLATIYELHASKAGLVRCVHEVRLEELNDRMQASAQGIGQPFDALMAGVRAAVENFMVHPNYLRINLREGHAWGLKEIKTPLPPAVEKSWHRTLDWMVPIFEEGIRRGVFYPDSPPLMARRTNAHVQVQMASWLEDPERLSAEDTIAELEEQMRRSFCRPTSAREE
ncbi:MAG: hypothetical protein CL908_23200 [Deltaproteobacteria bacterium]|jgi:AcrR family transcriptional regulator|nr:hypothetical protein [Deltaproteobacteria bacterium]